MRVQLYKSQNALSTLVNEMLNALDISSNTKKEYRRGVKVFLHYIKSNGFNKNSYLEYKRFLGGKINYTVSTKNKYLVAAKLFLRELCKQGLISNDITINIKSFKQSKLHKKVGINETEMLSINRYLNTLDNSFTSNRTKAMFSLLIFQGLRQIEVARLNVEDFDLKNKRAFIQGKGATDKEAVYLHPISQKIIAAYLSQIKRNNGALFFSTSNNSINKRITTKTVQTTVKSVLNKLSINKSVHGFRHFFTTQLIKSYKGNLVTVAKYTRHKSLEMLTVYNDSILRKRDLKRYYKVFDGIKL